VTLYQVTGTPNQPVHVVWAGSNPGVLVNRDESNSAYTSPNPGFSPGDPTCSIHDALIGIPYDGTTDVYATVEPGVSILMDYMENAQNWQPSPAQAAVQIAELGLATASNQGTQITHESNIEVNTGGGGIIGQLAGSFPSALVSAAGLHIASDFLAANTGVTRETAQQFLNANQGVTTEIAALLASGSPSGAPGGVPLLHGYDLLINDTATAHLTIAAGATAFPTVALKKPGYLISIAGEMAASGTVPFLEVTPIWYDSNVGAAAGQGYSQESWWVPMSDTVATMYTYGKGPTKGNELQLAIKNLSSQSASVYLLLGETTQHIARDDWRSGVLTGVPGYTSAPNQNPLGLILAGGGPAGQIFTVSQQYIYLLPLYSGQAFIDFNGPGTQSELTVAVADLNGNYMFSDVVGLGQGSNPGVNYRGTFYLPRQPCQLYIANAGPNAPNVFWGLTIVEYAS
jgi:hypothetical protein